MKISVVFANQAWVDPLVNLFDLRKVGTIWAAWNQWHQLFPHRTICHWYQESQRLIDAGFHRRCEMFVPETVFNALKKPRGVKSYGGEFLHEIPDPEELVAMFLAAAESDIVVLVGYNWALPDNNDSMATYIAENRLAVIMDAIRGAPDVQWIIAGDTVPEQLREFENVDSDTLENIINA